MEAQRYLIRYLAHHLVEVRPGATRYIDDQIARILRQLGKNVEQGGLADAAFTIEHHVQTLVLDGSDHGVQDFRTPSEQLRVGDRQ